MIEVPVGEDADDVGAAADLAVEPFVGVVGPDLARSFGKADAQVGAGGVEVLGDLGQLVLYACTRYIGTDSPHPVGIDGIRRVPRVGEDLG